MHKNGFKVPTRKVPSWMLKILSLFDPQAKAMLPLLDREIYCDNSETLQILKWKPIPIEKTFLDMAQDVQDILSKNIKVD